MSDTAASEMPELERAHAAKPRLGRGLPTVDVFLTIAAERHSISLWYLNVFLMEYGIKYHPRTLRWAVKRLAAAGYIMKNVSRYEGRSRREYSISPAVFSPPDRFFPPTKPGIAEVDLLLLVLSGERRPKRAFSLLWGDGSERIYRTAVRRLIRLGYLERDRGRWYHPGKRTVALRRNLQLT
jgi:hypothetical protein